MSSIKDIKENEQEKVSGGFEYTIKSLNIGDCFSYRVPNVGSVFLMCRMNYPDVQKNSMIEFDTYYDVINDSGYQGIQKVLAQKITTGIYGYDYFYSNKNYIPK